ncbi:MAG: GNAT family N-acetyltransferase [Deltaproteobacteria bacterium]|nr:GNAT family N-acetyltransferase [Deltaproteobacteria bacterium]MCB9478163.1 GNAT family N-acetyltransferase [Deltaproteobacteria bacterium]
MNSGYYSVDWRQNEDTHKKAATNAARIEDDSDAGWVDGDVRLEGQPRYELVALRPDELDHKTITRWRTFETKPERCNPYHTYGWFDAHRQPTNRRRVSPCALRDDMGFVGFFNVVVATHRLAFTVAEMPIFGRKVRMGMIAYPGLPIPPNPDAYRALVDGLFDALPEIDGLSFQAVPLTGSLYNFFHDEKTAAAARWFVDRKNVETQVRHLINDPDLIGRYEEHFSKKWIKRWRRDERQLGKLGEVRLQFFERPEDVEEFHHAARTVAAQSWQSDVLGPRLRDEDHRWMANLARNRLFLGTILWCGSTPIAFDYGYRHRDLYNTMETGYDRTYSPYSPGLLLLFKLVRHLYTDEMGVHVIDLEYGDAEYKRRFGTSSYEETIVNVYRHRPSIRMWLELIAELNRVYRWAVAILWQLGIKGRLRRLLQRKRVVETVAPPDTMPEAQPGPTDKPEAR